MVDGRERGAARRVDRRPIGGTCGGGFQPGRRFGRSLAVQPDARAEPAQRTTGGLIIATTVNLYHAQFANFSPDGRRLLLASIQGQARIWDVASGKEVADFGQQPTSIHQATFSPDGTRIVSRARRPATTRLWDARTSEPLGPPTKFRGVGSLALFSPDNSLVAVQTAEEVHVQDVRRNGAIVHSFQADGLIRSVRFSPDSHRLVTATNEGTAQVWDARTGVAVSEPMRHGLVRVSFAEFSPDGRFVRTETSDGKIHFWSVPPPLPTVAATPAWLLDLATLCAGKRRTDEGRLEDVSDTKRSVGDLCREVAALPDDATRRMWSGAAGSSRTRPRARSPRASRSLRRRRLGCGSAAAITDRQPSFRPREPNHQRHGRSILAGPLRRDLLALLAWHPDYHGLGAGRSGFVAHGIGRFDVASHSRLQNLAFAIDDVFELAGYDVEYLDRAVPVIARVHVRRKDDLADGNFRADVAFVQQQPEHRSARGAIRDALRFTRWRRGAHQKAQHDDHDDPTDDDWFTIGCSLCWLRAHRQIVGYGTGGRRPRLRQMAIRGRGRPRFRGISRHRQLGDAPVGLLGSWPPLIGDSRDAGQQKACA